MLIFFYFLEGQIKDKTEQNSIYLFKLSVFWKYAYDINYFNLGENYKCTH